MILQCNAAEFAQCNPQADDELGGNKLNQANNSDIQHKHYTRQEIFRLVPELLTRTGNPSIPGQQPVSGVVSALSLMQQNIDAVMFDKSTAQANGLELNSTLLTQIETLIENCGDDTVKQAVDPDAIDIIRMMFDIIFEDDRLTDDMKAIIARLQIPLLKVAILDKSYFGDKLHPAEELVNKLTDTAIELRNKSKADRTSFYKEVNFLINRILSEFKNDTSVFNNIMQSSSLFNNGKQAVTDHTTHHNKSIQNLRETTEKLKSLAKSSNKLKQTNQEKKQNKIAKIEIKPVIVERKNKQAVKPQVTVVSKQAARPDANKLISNAISKKIQNSKLPGELADFLSTTWVKVSQEIYKMHGECNDTLKKTLLVVDEAIWIAQPKTSNMDKLRLSSAIPQLITNIQDGLTRTRQNDPHKSKIFTLLLSIHATNLKEQRLRKKA